MPPCDQPALAQETVDLVLSMLIANPKQSDAEIAQATGVSRKSVWRMRQELSDQQTGADDTGDESTEQYGRRLSKRLPMSKRVRLWAELAEGRTDPRLAFAQKAALQRVEELIGHVTAKEKRDAEANNSAPGPIFIFAQQSVPSAAPVLTSTPQLEPDNAVPASVTKDKPDGSAT